MMRSREKHCIHVVAARKFLLSFLKLPEEALREDFDICYNAQCSHQTRGEKEHFGIPRRECEIPREYVGVGLSTGESIPVEMKKVIRLRNPVNSNQIDRLLGDIGEPTYREVPVGQEEARKAIREVFSLSHWEQDGSRKSGVGSPSNLLGKEEHSDTEPQSVDENEHSSNVHKEQGCGNRCRILEWFRDQKPVWDEDNYFVKSELFRSTPDWKRLETYKDSVSCEWGSARVFTMIQFWQASLTFTDRLVNNRDSSIVEYVGGNEESCLPLRLLVKFERRVLKQKTACETGPLPSGERPGYRLTREPQHANASVLPRSRDLQSLKSSQEDGTQTRDKEIDVRYLEMVRYIPGRDKSQEFRSLEKRFQDSDGSSCHLYIDSQRDFFLKLQVKYDKEIIHMIKTCIKGRRYDNESKLWLLPVETLYESVCMVEFLGGMIDRKVLSLLVNGSRTDLSHELFFTGDELENWRVLLPKSSRGTWYRIKIKFHLSTISEIYGGSSERLLERSFKLTFSKESFDKYHQNELIKRLRNSDVSVRWDSSESCWKLPIDQFSRVINTCRTSLEFCFSSMLDHLVFKRVQEMIKDHGLQSRISNLGKGSELGRKEHSKPDCSRSSNRNKRPCLFDSDEEAQTPNSCYPGSEPEGDRMMEMESGESRQVLILSCLGKDDHDNKRLETRISSMIKKIKTPKHIDKIEFLLWPKHYKDWESISFLIISKDFVMNIYHPKLLLSIVSNVMIVSEGMIDYVMQKNTWPDNSFETKFELDNGLPSLESRLYINEGIFCKTKLFIVGPPGNNHFKLCTRLATLGSASFVQDPLLADYIIICDESDPGAIQIKKSVPKKQATKVQNTHGETHSIQVTPKWVYDVVLDFTIIKPTSKRKHKAWLSGY